ncbi:MAG: efflux RND transporter periplasmic adaptor subunit [Sedimentisphaerales bacterium]|nr:efflux RND transporter periplasmic adaptor subunit [Sedimentisphaerales bacterium]
MGRWQQKMRGFLSHIGNYWLLILVCLAIGVLLGRWWGPGEQKTPVGQDTAAVEQGVIWTCSMHPQVQLPRPGLCPICNMPLIRLETGSDADQTLRDLTVSTTAAALMDVEVAPVQRRFATAQVRMVGTIEYDETKLADITAWVPGRIEDLFVDYTGVPVTRGDHMVALYSPELLSAQEELLQALELTGANSGNDLLRDVNQSTLAAAREKLRLFGLTTDQVAEIEQRGTASDRLTINAPASGIVIHKDAMEGMYVNTGTRIYTIADLSSVWVMLNAYESDLMWLRYGQAVDFELLAYPGESFSGTISYIDPIVTQPSRTVRVRVNADNAEGWFKPGMFVRATVQSEIAGRGQVMDVNLAGKFICPMHPDVVEDSDGQCPICYMPLVPAESLGYTSAVLDPNEAPLLIPVSAALITGERAIVYVRSETDHGARFEGREVVLGPRAGDYYLVRSGLRQGEMVVTRGNFQIDSALQLRGAPSMMSMPSQGQTPSEVIMETLPVEPLDATQVDALMRLRLNRLAQHALAVAAELNAADGQASQADWDELEARIAAIEDEVLTGDAARLWRELEMRLTNDIVQGRNAQSAEERQYVAESLTHNANLLQVYFGLVDNAARSRTDTPRVPEEHVH